jgi:hypothetical protein
MRFRQFQLLMIIFLGATAGRAQPFSSGSTGSDGALNLTTPGTINFDPDAMGLNPARDNIFNFTAINIGQGVTVNMSANLVRQKSVVFLATGAITINGTLNLSGAPGYVANSPSSAQIPSIPGPGGYGGGTGGTLGSPPQPGAGPGGGSAGAYCGSYATAGCYGAPVYGNSMLVPLRGGSGGGGAFGVSGSGGSAGGGAIQIVSSVSITINGSILANGGINDCVACSGAGGAIHLEAPIVAGTGTVQALGGSSNGQTYGGNGWLRVDTTSNNFTGQFQPAAIFGVLFNVPLPTAVPTVTITSINGMSVPAAPTASYTAPDVIINNGTAVPVAIAATNVPVGTVVMLYVSSETGTGQVVSASPLAGTVASSTATASIVWPLGVSRVYVRAVW